MPFDRRFAQALVDIAAENGWNTELPEGLSNPLPLKLVRESQALNILVHARRITPQSSETSDHHRRAGEWHMQLTFDGDDKGPGARNYLRFREDYRTLLLGFDKREEGYLVAAFDPAKHLEFGWSSSAQVRSEYLSAAEQSGFAVQVRENDEAVVIFRLEQIFEYLASRNELHRLTQADLEETLHDETASGTIRTFARQALEASELPVLVPSARQQRTTEVTSYIRNRQFTRGIINAYQRCAICGFQYDYVLDAAHIVPVADGGTDTYDNGLGLCPNCHRMFDRGLILVDENRKIHLHPQRAEEYAAIGLADSLDDLRRTIREELWLPDDPQYHPSSENLRRTFQKHRE